MKSLGLLVRNADRAYQLFGAARFHRGGVLMKALVLGVAAIAALMSFVAPVRAYDLEGAAKAFRDGNGWPQPRPLSPLRGWQGSDSELAEPGVTRVTDADGWATLWRSRQPGVAPPPVDFAQEMVVAVFTGTISKSWSPTALYTAVEADELEITTENSRTDVMITGTKNDYLFIVLRQSDRRYPPNQCHVGQSAESVRGGGPARTAAKIAGKHFAAPVNHPTRPSAPFPSRWSAFPRTEPDLITLN
jgi:hypothetical protein